MPYQFQRVTNRNGLFYVRMRHYPSIGPSRKMSTDFVAPAENSKNFLWSFKPVLMWMQLIGIDLSSSQQQFHSNTHRYCLHLYAVFMFLFDAASMLSFMYFLVEGIVFPPSNLMSSTSKRIIYLNSFNSIASILSAHFLLITVTAAKWNELWQILQQIQTKFPLNDNHFRQCRKAAVISLLMLFVVISQPFLIVNY